MGSVAVWLATHLRWQDWPSRTNPCVLPGPRYRRARTKPIQLNKEGRKGFIILCVRSTLTQFPNRILTPVGNTSLYLYEMSDARYYHLAFAIVAVVVVVGVVKA